MFSLKPGGFLNLPSGFSNTNLTLNVVHCHPLFYWLPMLNHSERIVELGAVADRTPNRKIVGALRRGRRGGFDEGKVQTPFLGGINWVRKPCGWSMVIIIWLNWTFVFFVGNCDITICLHESSTNPVSIGDITFCFAANHITNILLAVDPGFQRSHLQVEICVSRARPLRSWPCPLRICRRTEQFNQSA
jgi:hypothetical protein